MPFYKRGFLYLMRKRGKSVLLLLIFLVPPDWFWVVYLIQAFNVSGAAGDLYATVLFARLPKHILVQDTGTAMTVYAPQSK